MSDFSKPPEETGREHLGRALAGLPSHEPEAATWLHIAAQLDAEQAIVQAIPALPAHEPDAALWNAITYQLDEAEAPAAVAFRPLWPADAWRRVASIAAVVLLLLGMWWLVPTSSEKQVAIVPHETITFSEEEVAVPVAVRPAVPADPLAQEGKAFIDAHCTSLPTVCQSDEFRELRTQLTEVEEQERRLQQDARRFGSSPALVRQQVQLTTLRATLTRELVQLLIS